MLNPDYVMYKVVFQSPDLLVSYLAARDQSLTTIYNHERKELLNPLNLLSQTVHPSP